MLVYQKTMFDRYFCIKSFCLLKSLDKRFEKFINVLLCKIMKDSVVLKKPVPEQRLT